MSVELTTKDQERPSVMLTNPSRIQDIDVQSDPGSSSGSEMAVRARPTIEPPARLRQAPAARPSHHQQQVPGRPPQMGLSNNMFTHIVNQDKKKPVNYHEDPESGSEEEFDSEDDMEEGDYDGSEAEEEQESDEVPGKSPQQIESEKSDMLMKLYNIQQKDPSIQLTRKLGMHNSYKDIKFEYDRISDYLNKKSAIKMGRDVLGTCVSVMEHMNRTYDPFNVKLDGWAEHVISDIERYDNVFGKLHDKYKSSVDVAPELELLMMLGTSAMMFHVQKTLFDFNVKPNLQNVMNSNPELMQKLQQAMNTQMQQPSAPSQPPAPEQPNIYEYKQSEFNQRRPTSGTVYASNDDRSIGGMKPPTAKFGDLLGGNFQNPVPGVQPPQPTGLKSSARESESESESDRISVESDSSSDSGSRSPKVKTLNMKPGARRGKMGKVLNLSSLK